MRLGSRNRRQGDRRNRQMFFEAPWGEPVQVILPRIKLSDNRKVAKRDPLVVTLLGRVYITLSLVWRLKTP
jgi:hypothetical protein